MASRVERLAQAKAKLNALPASIRQGIAEALDKGADEIVEAQKRMAPPDKTGALRKSIRKVSGGGKNSAGLKDDLRIRVVAGGKTAPHAHLVEFGTAERTVKNYFGHQGVEVNVGAAPAKPFFYPAYRAYKKRVTSRASRAVKKAAREVAKG